MKYYASVRLDIRRVTTIKKGDQAKGNRVRVRVVKNKVAPPLGQAEFDILYGTGIDATGDLLDTAVKDEVVTKSGAWFSYKGEKIGQGRERARQWLESNDTIKQAILKVMLSAAEGPPLDKTG